MDRPMMPGGKRTAAALAVVAALLWGLARFGGKPPASPTPAAVVAPPALAAPVKPKRRARGLLAAAPIAPTSVRGAALREKGEAFGGTAPDSVDKDKAPAH